VQEEIPCEGSAHKQTVSSPSSSSSTSHPDSRRAVDHPDWKRFESAQKSGFTWDMVLRTFGPNMVIRILLRRQDYDQLYSMIDAGMIRDQADLRFCLESMDKIKQHNDIHPDFEKNYHRLYQYLKALGAQSSQ
jgi:hypothetical protein